MELARLHSLNATDGLPCDKLFLDIGAHTGNFIFDFFTRANCYGDSCGGSAACQPGNWSAASCTFCGSANLARQCGWMFPWWLPLSVRRGYCAVAFEPNPNVADRLRAKVAELQKAVPGVSVRVVTGTAVSVRDGDARFGLDEGEYEGRSSSLALSRTSPRKHAAGTPAGDPMEVGQQKTIMVKTIDLVRYLKGLRVRSVGMSLDTEGSEFELLRDLMLSGVLCSKVDDLWVDWHPGGRISWSKERLPTKDDEMHKVYKWMLNSVDNAAKHATGQSDSESHCKTVMYTVGQ